MSSPSGISRQAAVAVGDMLDCCARVRAGQEVLIAAHVEGLHGGDNLVDEQAVSWIQMAVEARGANASTYGSTRLPRPTPGAFLPVLKAAIEGSDVFINNLFDLSFEEIVEFKQFLWARKKLMVRNMATTAPLLCSAGPSPRTSL